MLTHLHTILVEWGDCDPAGIVYFPRYLEWFDACTSALFAHAGLRNPQTLADYGIVGVPVVDLTVRFVVPSRFGDEVAVESGVSRWGRSSFDVHHRLMRGRTLAVEATVTRVWTVREAGTGALRSAPIPDEIRSRLG